MISPSCHSSGMFSLSYMLLRTFVIIFLVDWFASIRVSFGILSGPLLFPLFSCLMHLFTSSIEIGSVVAFWVMFVNSVILLFILLVHDSCVCSPSRAWYRSSK